MRRRGTAASGPRGPRRESPPDKGESVRASESLPHTAELAEAAFTPLDVALCAVVVLSWSASWYVLKLNASYAVSAPVRPAGASRSPRR